MNSVFITGTDTGVGKTSVAVCLLKLFNNNGLRTFGIKPVACGCDLDSNGQLINADALALQRASSIKCDYRRVNPIALAEPIAPNIAAMLTGVELTLENTIESLLRSIHQGADINIIEGIGGWSVPLNNVDLFSDVVCSLGIPVILVVGVKLGCLNHAILTCKSIINSKLPFIGWIANCIESNTVATQENIATLKQWIPVPCLGIIPYNFHSRINIFNIKYIIDKLFLNAGVT